MPPRYTSTASASAAAAENARKQAKTLNHLMRLDIFDGVAKDVVRSRLDEHLKEEKGMVIKPMSVDLSKLIREGELRKRDRKDRF